MAFEEAGGDLAWVFGVAAGWLMPVLQRPADDSAEAGFARDMQVHYAQAVEMSMMLTPAAPTRTCAPWPWTSH